MRENLLVVGANWLGDALLSLPAIEALGSLFPRARITLLIKEPLADLFRNNPLIDELIPVPSSPGLRQTARRLKQGKYDLALLLPNSFRAALTAWLAGIPERVGYRANGRSLLLTKSISRAPGWNRWHQSEYYLCLVRALGETPKPGLPTPIAIGAQAGTPRVWPGEAEERWADALLSSLGAKARPIVVISPSAAYGPAKRWFPERYAELGRRLIADFGCQVIVTGSREDVELTEKIVQDMGPGSISLAGKTTLLQLSALARRSTLFITNDSGPMHLAAASGAFVVAIFGSTDPAKSRPLGEHLILREEMDCSPCFKRSCQKDYECLRAITVERAYKEVAGLLVERSENVGAVSRLKSGDGRPKAGTSPAATSKTELGSPGCLPSTLSLRTKGNLGQINVVPTDVGIATSPPLPALKIALAIKEFFLERGGGEKYAVALARELMRMGHEVHIFANRCDSSPMTGLFFHRVSMIKAPAFLKVLSFCLSCHRELKKEKFDLVYGLTQIFHQDIHRLGGGLHRFWLAQKYPSRFRRALARLEPINIAFMAVEKRILKPGNYGRIITNSRMCREQLVSLYHVPQEKIEVVYNGVDTSRFTIQAKERYCQLVRGNYGIDPDELVLLFVSHNFRRKRLDTVLRALSHLERTGKYRLLVVGAGRAGRYRRLAQELGVSHKLIFAGRAPFVEKFYGAADILILPTLYDPFSNVCLEAMACGLPVITTKYNGAAELLSGGAGLIMKDPGDSRDLAAKVLELSEKSAREKAGLAANSIAKELTWEKNAKRTLEVFQNLLKEKG